MRVVILNQFFYPDHSATSQLMTDLAENLVKRGVEVTALAGRGSYNGGEKFVPEETRGGVRIKRAWSTSFGKKYLPGRLCDYLTFYLGASWTLMRMPRHDIVMALTTPPLINLIAYIFGKRLRGMRLIALMQDVYPDVAVALGVINHRNPIVKIFNLLNRLALNSADRIVVLGECMKACVSAKIKPERRQRIDVIHNWAIDDGTAIGEKTITENRRKRNDEVNPFIVKHKLQNRFVVMFSGNLGHVNDFSTILDTARRLRERSDIVFVIIGEGAKKHEIECFVAAHQLENVRLLSYQPLTRLSNSLAAGDVHLVTLANGFAGLSVPSKTYGILAAGRPVVFVGDTRSEVASLVRQNDCGAVFSSGDDENLAGIIVAWADNKEQLERHGRAARELFERRFARHHAVEAYLESFGKAVEGDLASGFSVENSTAVTVRTEGKVGGDTSGHKAAGHKA